MAGYPTTSAPPQPTSSGRDVLGPLDRALTELERAGRSDLVARIRHERRRVTDPICNVLVVGEFKKGKSALINAILNARVCAVDPVAATAVPTVVRCGTQLAVHVVEHSGRDDGGASERPDGSEPRGVAATAPHRGPNGRAERRIDLAGIHTTTTDAFSEGVTQRAQSAVVELPRDLLQQGLVLIDTPGVNGGLTAAHAAATVRALAHADAVIFVTDASQELSQPELDFFRQAARMCPTVVCALTKIDFYPEWRRLLELDKAHLARAGAAVPMFALSAPLRHYGVRVGDDTADLESGYPQLAGYLRHHVIGRKEELATRAAAAAARHALEQIASRVAAEYATLANPSSVQDLRERLTEAKHKAARMHGAAAEWQQLHADRFTDMASNVETDLTRRVRRLRDEAQERVDQLDPVSNWSDFQAWFHQRVNEEVIEHFAKMRNEVDQVVAEVADRFDADVAMLGVYRDLVPETVQYEVDALDAKFIRLSRGQLAFAMLRGSTGSMPITGMIGTFIAVLPFGPPAWFAPVAVIVGGAALARSSSSAAREAQVRANRAEALKTVRSHLEEVELVTRKDSRDTMRRINQRLRNYLRARAAELETSAKQNLEATARAVKADHSSSQAQLTRLRADLERVRTIIGELDALIGAPHSVGSQPSGGGSSSSKRSNRASIEGPASSAAP